MTLAVAKAKLLEGKRGLIVGIANDQSIAWGCARAFRSLGAELAITYLSDKARPYVEPLAREVEAECSSRWTLRRRGRWKRYSTASRMIGEGWIS